MFYFLLWSQSECERVIVIDTGSTLAERIQLQTGMLDPGDNVFLLEYFDQRIGHLFENVVGIVSGRLEVIQEGCREFSGKYEIFATALCKGPVGNSTKSSDLFLADLKWVVRAFIAGVVPDGYPHRFDL